MSSSVNQVQPASNTNTEIVVEKPYSLCMRVCRVALGVILVLGTCFIALAFPVVRDLFARSRITLQSGFIKEYSEFIKDNYDVTFTGKGVGKNGEGARIFLLQDIHNESLYAIVNALFINTMAGSDDTVLIEGHPSMQDLDPSTTAMSVRLRTAAKVKGWDLGTMSEMAGEVLASPQKMQQQADLEALKEKYGVAAPEERPEILDEAKKISKAQYGEIRDLNLDILISCNPLSNFRKRTDAMEQSILSASQASEQVFLIAGYKHLDMRDGHRDICPTAEMLNIQKRLKKFRDRIGKLPVVVLRPKQTFKSDALEAEKEFTKHLQGMGIQELLGLTDAKMEEQQRMAADSDCSVS